MEAHGVIPMWRARWCTVVVVEVSWYADDSDRSTTASPGFEEVLMRWQWWCRWRDWWGDDGDGHGVVVLSQVSGRGACKVEPGNTRCGWCVCDTYAVSQVLTMYHAVTGTVLVSQMYNIHVLYPNIDVYTVYGIQYWATVPLSPAKTVIWLLWRCLRGHMQVEELARATPSFCVSSLLLPLFGGLALIRALQPSDY